MGKKKKQRNPVNMGRRRIWLCFKDSILVPTKCLLLKVTSCSRNKAQGKNSVKLVSFSFFFIFIFFYVFLVFFISLTWLKLQETAMG